MTTTPAGDSVDEHVELAPPNEAAALTPTERRRVVWAGFIGSTVEFYDFGVYGYLATTVAVLFFPSVDPVAALLSTLAIFAIAFVVRPIGGILLGHYGDKFGRKKALALSVIAMAIATVITGLLPTYAAIGIGAPILLLAARLLQGLSAGGEIGGAATMVAESAPNNRRGFLCSSSQAGSLAGLLLASAVVGLTKLACSPEQLASWGWRIPFLLALPTGLIGLYVRRRLEDSPAFERISREGEVARVPILEVFRHNRGPVLKAFGVAAVDFAGYYVVFVYLTIYLSKEGPLSASAASWSTTATILIAAVTLPMFGLLSDRIGRRKVVTGAAIAFVVLPLPMFMLLSGSSPALAILAQIVLGLCVSAIMGALWATLAEMFNTKVRFSGMALGFNVAAALVGGTAPYLSQWLIGAFGSPIAPAYFLIVMALVTLGTTFTLRETARTDLVR